MIQVSIGNGTVSVEYEGLSPNEYGGYRRRYRYVITANGWQYVGNDIESGVSASVDEPGMLGTLLSFLAACVESRQYRDRNGYGGENSDLFPDHVAEWAETYSDEISLAAYELDPDATE